MGEIIGNEVKQGRVSFGKGREVRELLYWLGKKERWK